MGSRKNFVESYLAAILKPVAWLQNTMFASFLFAAVTYSAKANNGFLPIISFGNLDDLIPLAILIPHQSGHFRGIPATL